MNDVIKFLEQIGVPESLADSINRDTTVVVKSNMVDARQYTCQVSLEASVNMLARLFPYIRLEVDDIPATYLKTNLPLRSYLVETIKESYKWEYTEGSPQNEIYLVFGNEKVDGKAIYIDADGWLSYIGTSPSNIQEKSNSYAPIGAVVAACLGVSEVFKYIYKDFIKKEFTLVKECLWFNTLTYNNNRVNTPVNHLILDKVTLFGCGSVGSALLYTLGFMPDISGNLDLVDRDVKVDHENMQRYVYLTLSDIEKFRNVSKAQWAEEKTKTRINNLQITSYSGKSGDVRTYLNRKDSMAGIKLAISALDNEEARIDVADCLAKRTINAGTGDTTLTISRHGFGDGRACIACEYISSLPNVNWYQQVAAFTGLHVERVATLLQNRSLLQKTDLDVLASKGIITHESIEALIGTDLSSIVRRRFYGQVEVNGNANKSDNKPITVPFVSLMAGALLAGELIKEQCGLVNSWEENKYRVDMLNVPLNHTYRFWARKNMDNKCVCKNSFRIKKFQEIWVN